MPAYLIAEHIVTDPAKFQEYVTKVRPITTILLVCFNIFLGLLVLLFADQSFSKAAIELMCPY